MSKALVQKALGLLQDDSKLDNSLKNSKPTSKKYKKTEKNWNSDSMMSKTSPGIGKSYAKLDRTAENLRILKQLRRLKPDASVAQKVIEFYKQRSVEDPAEKPEEVQRSILFDDDDEKAKKKKKKKKKTKNASS